MLPTTDRIIEVLYSTIEELNEALAPGARLSKAPETALFGRNGRLDSLGLVNLVLTAEQKLTATFDRPVMLAQSLLSDGTDSPPATVQALAGYVSGMLEDQADG